MDEKTIKLVKKLAFDMADKLNSAGINTLELEFEGIKIRAVKEMHTHIPEAAAQTQVFTAPVFKAQEKTVIEEETVDGNEVKSPIVGTFYASSSPEAEPFVHVGSQVKRGDVLCIIEAMKTLNEIESEFEGTVTRIFAESGKLVEYGQPIMLIEP